MFELDPANGIRYDNQNNSVFHLIQTLDIHIFMIGSKPIVIKNNHKGTSKMNQRSPCYNPVVPCSQHASDPGFSARQSGPGSPMA